MTAAASSLDEITPPLGYTRGKRVFNLIVFYCRTVSKLRANTTIVSLLSVQIKYNFANCIDLIGNL